MLAPLTTIIVGVLVSLVKELPVQMRIYICIFLGLLMLAIEADKAHTPQPPAMSPQQMGNIAPMPIYPDVRPGRR